MTTTALLCVARNELPYTNEWIDHHLQLGIDQVYYVSTDDDRSAVEEFFEASPHRDNVRWSHVHRFELGWQMRCSNQHLAVVDEDWLFVLDLDEFLCLHDVLSVSEWLDSMPDDVDQVQLPWANVISNGYANHRTLDILERGVAHVADHVKSFVRRRAATGLGARMHGVDGSRNCLSSGERVPPGNRHVSVVLGFAARCRPRVRPTTVAR